jgi:hypothetical protein
LAGGKRVSREDAKARKVGYRVSQLAKAFCGHESVLECSGLAELGMADAAGVSPIILMFWRAGKGVSREDAKARKVGDRPSSAVTQDVL